MRTEVVQGSSASKAPRRKKVALRKIGRERRVSQMIWKCKKKVPRETSLFIFRTYAGPAVLRVVVGSPPKRREA